MGTRMTKNEMARVIIQALFNLEALPEEDYWRVVRCMRAGKHADLVDQYELAQRILAKRGQGAK
jgi:hypothetical protein